MRPKSLLDRSLELLRVAKQIEPRSRTKSGLMVGLGEEMAEVKELLDQMREHDIEIITIGQYLRPSLKHHPLIRYWHPDEFAELKAYGKCARLQARRIGAARPLELSRPRAGGRCPRRMTRRGDACASLGLARHGGLRRCLGPAARDRAGARAPVSLADDAVLLLEHPPVYTMGRQGEARHLGAGPDALVAAGAEFLEVDRGGSVTFHGPGQLVAYPIVRLAGIFPIPGHPAHGDVDRYLRALEAGLIATAATYGVEVTRRPPYTGVWSGERKLAAIGVKLAGGVTSHGVALNVATDLSWFDRVTPCGIEGAGVASLETLGAPGHSPEEVAPVLAAKLASAFGCASRQRPAWRAVAPTREKTAA